MESKLDEKVKTVLAWVCCHQCGEEHTLKPGLVSPTYVCNGVTYSLIEGDEVFTNEPKA